MTLPRNRLIFALEALFMLWHFICAEQHGTNHHIQHASKHTYGQSTTERNNNNTHWSFYHSMLDTLADCLTVMQIREKSYNYPIIK